MSPEEITAMGNIIGAITKQVIYFSIINSFVVFGILSTIKKLADKEKLHRFIGVVLTYCVGFIMGFMIAGVDIWWQKLVYGLAIGSCSVAVYKSATKSLLEIIPTVVNKFLK